MSTPPSTTSKLVSMFRDRFVVEVGSATDQSNQLGSGVLLQPRVVATCRHVVEDGGDALPTRERVWVRRRDANAVSAKPLVVAREGAYDDVALLVLDEPLGLQDEPYPTLLACMTDDMADSLCGLVRDGRAVLRSGGFYTGHPKTITMAIDAPTIGSGDVAIWYQLPQGQTQNSSGGPLWIAPPTLESTSGVRSAGLVVGLMAVDANPSRTKPLVPGVIASGAVTADSVLELRDRLGECTKTSPEQRDLLDGIVITQASEALAWLRRHSPRDLGQDEPARDPCDQGAVGVVLPPISCRPKISKGSPISPSGLLLVGEPQCDYIASHRWQVRLHIAFRQHRIPPDGKMTAYLAFAARGACFEAKAESSAIKECRAESSPRSHITRSIAPGEEQAEWNCFPKEYEGRNPGYLEDDATLLLTYQASEGASLSTYGRMTDTVFVDASGNSIRDVLKRWALHIRLWSLGKRLTRPSPWQIEAHHRIVLVPDGKPERVD